MTDPSRQVSHQFTPAAARPGTKLLKTLAASGYRGDEACGLQVTVRQDAFSAHFLLPMSDGCGNLRAVSDDAAPGMISHPLWVAAWWGGLRVQNNTCAESGAYTGVSIKF